MDTKAYIQQSYDRIAEKNAHQPEFLQAVHEVFETLEPVIDKHPEYIEENILERMAEPERIISFRVPWVDDNGRPQVNRGYRVQFNSAIGPYKGGIRFDPSVNESILKFLGFEQMFKNALTGLPMGGGKGGADFNSRDKSNQEIMRFCQSYMTELQRYIGPDVDVPAGDIGVGALEVGYMYGQYKRLNGPHAGVITGKPVKMYGSLARTEATGYGIIYYTNELLNDNDLGTLEGKRIVISGAGNVGSHALQKAQELGAKVIAISNIDGYLVNENGLDFETLKPYLANRPENLAGYAADVEGAEFFAGGKVWNHGLEYDIAIPAATQNELGEEEAKNIVKSGCRIMIEGANMPNKAEAVEIYRENNFYFAPAKAANAGGVAVSGLEMTQNATRLPWSFEEVDSRLQEIMKGIYAKTKETATTYGKPGDLAAGANLYGFELIADVMIMQGVI